MWGYIVYAILLILAYVLAPKPPPPEDAQVQQGEVPTANANEAIPVIFGTVRIKQPNVVWWGAARTEAIYSKSGK